jgi:hypothetical protein
MALLKRYPDKVENDVLNKLKEDPALFEVSSWQHLSKTAIALTNTKMFVFL